MRGVRAERIEPESLVELMSLRVTRVTKVTHVTLSGEGRVGVMVHSDERNGNHPRFYLRCLHNHAVARHFRWADSFGFRRGAVANGGAKLW